MLLFASFEKKIQLKKTMSIIGFPKDFIVNKIKQKHCTCCFNKRLCSLVTKALGCFHEVFGSNLGKLCK
jgi:hypothetical protein